ncbi:hypothetical protein F5148DRAFT_782651 [Russula earlei]|uniref:Uncharacterized protein n=1 Tax=Russula earlei TaxID=71964 RepID=A0ACC0UC36_9AGAM|nr:hypothetical protein F5148DRAFT_782651 [Russula earlei]
MNNVTNQLPIISLRKYRARTVNAHGRWRPRCHPNRVTSANGCGSHSSLREAKGGSTASAEPSNGVPILSRKAAAARGINRSRPERGRDGTTMRSEGGASSRWRCRYFLTCNPDSRVKISVLWSPRPQDAASFPRDVITWPSRGGRPLDHSSNEGFHPAHMSAGQYNHYWLSDTSSRSKEPRTSRCGVVQSGVMLTSPGQSNGVVRQSLP